MDPEGESMTNSLGLAIGAPAKSRAHAEANAAADAAAKWLLVGGMVAVLTALLGIFTPNTWPFLLAMTYAVASGVGLAKYRAAPRSGRRFLLVPLTALLLACGPTIFSLHGPSITQVLGTLLGLFVMPLLVDFVLQRVPAAHSYSVVVLTGAACFATSGLGVLIALFLIPAFALTTWFAIARSTAAGQHTASRLVFAASIGFGFAWLGLHLQCTSFQDLPPPDYGHWFVHYPAGSAHYQTLMVAGFPIQLVEGHGGGGGHVYLPWEKGLGVLLANYLICLSAAWLASLWIPARALFTATAAGIAFSIVAGLAGWYRLLWMVD